MGVEYIAYFILAIFLLFIVVKIFSWPLKILLSLIGNAVLGTLLLFFLNIVGGFFNFSIGINIWTALIAGFFGIPGVIFLIIFKLFL
ncbi:pro-sigmaK processing inhibitor BofA family protein [Clostridium sp. Marseille-Q2269]|uniref:pro-sigmaK processing inhibitor BofA family protein n=1 Tax=Clostridium sp. Marseille-Q2269 TaxID=2942205 RepID=UPI0020733772|nr:pro-sigmaK processing inhibitor BofA family protein [Clostridium sp. Marseille-Q2269]